jgi:hypothetical protein
VHETCAGYAGLCNEISLSRSQRAGVLAITAIA